MNSPKVLTEEQLDQLLRTFSTDTRVTRGAFNFPADCSVDDLDWNHMDQDHRPYIHNTYKKAIRIYTAENVAVSLTELRVLFFDFLMLVTDVKIRRGLFYQCYSVFSLFYVHGILDNRDDGMTYRWFIVSPRWLKFLHPYLSRRIYNLNDVQVNEDVSLRKSRFQLRKDGYSFGPEERDYLTSNNQAMYTKYPAAPQSVSFSVGELPIGKITTFKNEKLELLILKYEENCYRVWRSKCPHEGGPLEGAELCNDNSLICPWHGLKFFGVEFTPKSPQKIFGDLKIELVDKRLIVTSPTA